MFAAHIPRNAFDIRLKKASFDEYLRSISGLSPQHNLQEPDGLVAGAWNTAVPLGRNVALNGDFATDTIWIKGVGWTIAGGVAHSDGTQLVATTISQSILLYAGKSWLVTFDILNYVAGFVRFSLGASQFGSFQSGDGTYPQEIAITGGNNFLYMECTEDFVGDVDNVTLQQTGIRESGVYPGAELLNTAGASGTATAANWTEVSFPVLTNPVVGTLRVSILTADSTGLASQFSLTAGVRYIVQGETRTSGINNASPRVYQNVTGELLFIGTLNGTVYEPFNLEFVADGTDISFAIISNAASETYAEFRNISVTEVNPLNGDHVATTVGVATGLRSMPYAARYNGGTSYTDIYSAGLNSVFNPSAGTLIVFAKSTTWAAGIDYLINLQVDANNWVSMSRSATNLIASYKAGGTDESVTIASGSPGGWFMVALTWDTTGAGAVKAYYNGVQSGATQTIAGTWVGNLAATTTVIGALSTTPTNSWLGDGVPPRLANRALTAIEIGDIYQRWGI